MQGFSDIIILISFINENIFTMFTYRYNQVIQVRPRPILILSMARLNHDKIFKENVRTN